MEYQPKKKERPEIFKLSKTEKKWLLRFILALIIVHVAVLAAYLLFFSSVIMRSVTEGTNKAKEVTVAYSLIATVLFPIGAAFFEKNDITGRKEVRDLAKSDPSFSIFQYVKGKMNIPVAATIFYGLLQLPFAIFYGILGYVYYGETGIERFFVMDVGAYELTGNFFLGFLINVVLFFALFTLSRGLVMYGWSKYDPLKD